MTARGVQTNPHAIASLRWRRRRQAAAGTLIACSLDTCRREYSKGHGAALPWVVNGHYCSQTCLEQAIQRGAITSHYRQFGPRQAGARRPEAS